METGDLSLLGLPPAYKIKLAEMGITTLEQIAFLDEGFLGLNQEQSRCLSQCPSKCLVKKYVKDIQIRQNRIVVSVQSGHEAILWIKPGRFLARFGKGENSGAMEKPDINFRMEKLSSLLCRSENYCRE